MSYSIIAAVGKNNELGKNNDLIWHLKEDLKFFKQMTTNKTIIMGSNTFYSLPHMLPNRHHVVLSSKDNFPSEVEVYHSINELLEKYKDNPEELFVIGGARVYSEFLDLSDKLYLTEINDTCDNADVFFPEFDRSLYEVEEISSIENETPTYKHVLYKRKPVI